ncbi:MAG: tRNA (adenosine(37)-N6)-threonylcarbamoyltransferase complex dimerization subunit type 1 TsaB [Chloroflexi bacterium]|nr:MAG: tRNA (adenosine(37)-N6)-threonylcarbamoyltransferase complex dimerization subunit type 1 TsaB [Chloroflexota bacterium]MBL1192824.1 tRNA (adenosine(37)-N6)-threonylcarbamoyltransferase complex dimerization subunit type 1 TsaB [Chloroflexota bacterium]NOH10117.1 tRNA (adenosine(37)-N6)-threonylcarbamoyltransferase complex dimerization subunit type 1 TsaB [Chloroflexota bacterium]
MLLALDTSTKTMGIAIYDGVSVLNESTWASGLHHTIELAPAIEDALQRAKVSLEDIEVIGVAKGPGSYTGLRIGLAVAKGLALAHHFALVGVSSLDVIATAQPLQDAQLAAVLEAGRGRLAVGWYQVKEESWQAKGDPEVLTPEELTAKIKKPTVVAGELNADARKVLARKHKNAILASPALSVRRPSILAELAWRRWQNEETDDPATLAPDYLAVGEPIPS